MDPVATVTVVMVEEDMEAVVDMVIRTLASIPLPPLDCQARVVPQAPASQTTLPNGPTTTGTWVCCVKLRPLRLK